ncbi:unnamed protein product, partial [Candidula unifasciata]
MWALVVVLLVFCIGAGHSSRVITSARDRYQRPHGLDQLHYMLASQADYQQLTAQSTNGRPGLTSPANGRPGHAPRTTTRQPLVTNVTQETSDEQPVADIRDFPYVASVQ